jgi:hypothetical protein
METLLRGQSLFCTHIDCLPIKRSITRSFCGKLCKKLFQCTPCFSYLQKTLDKLVELDYSIVYFHYGLRSNNKPPIKWLLQAYQLLDRNYKKNLKALYIVHPTRFIKIVWTLFQPFISAKFANKVSYVKILDELNASAIRVSFHVKFPII